MFLFTYNYLTYQPADFNDNNGSTGTKLLLELLLLIVLLVLRVLVFQKWLTLVIAEWRKCLLLWLFTSICALAYGLVMFGPNDETLPPFQFFVNLILFGTILGLFLAHDITLLIAICLFVQDAYYQPEQVWDDAKRVAVFVVVAIVFLLFIAVLVSIAGGGGSSTRNKRLKS